MSRLIFSDDMLGDFYEDDIPYTPYYHHQYIPNMQQEVMYEKELAETISGVVNTYPDQGMIEYEMLSELFDQFGIHENFVDDVRVTYRSGKLPVVTREDRDQGIFLSNGKFNAFIQDPNMAKNFPTDNYTTCQVDNKTYLCYYPEDDDEVLLTLAFLLIKLLKPSLDAKITIQDWFVFDEEDELQEEEELEAIAEEPLEEVQEVTQPITSEAKISEPVLEYQLITSETFAIEKIPVSLEPILEEPIPSVLREYDVQSNPPALTADQEQAPVTSENIPIILEPISILDNASLSEQASKTSSRASSTIHPPSEEDDAFTNRWVSMIPSKPASLTTDSDLTSVESVTEHVTGFFSNILSREHFTVPATLAIAQMVNLAFQLRNILHHVKPSNPGRWKLLTNTIVTLLLAIIYVLYYFKLITADIPYKKLIRFVRFHLTPVTFDNTDYATIKEASKKLRQGLPIPTSLQVTNPIHVKVAKFVCTFPSLPPYEAMKECYAFAYTSEEGVDLSADFRSIIAKFNTQSELNVDSLISTIIMAMSLICGTLMFSGVSAPAMAMKEFRKALKDYSDNKKSLTQLKEDILSVVAPKSDLMSRSLKLRDKMHNLVSIPNCIILADASLMASFNSIMKDVAILEEIILRNHSGNHAFNSFLNMAASLRVKNTELVNLTLSQAGKQKPVAMYFYGPMGIGKTTLILNQFVQDVAAKIGIPPLIYDMKPDDKGFFREYAGQPFAFSDEMGAVPGEVNTVKNINEIVGPSGKEMSGAYAKKQPFVSPFVILISNFTLYEMIHGIKMHHTSQDAFVTRFLEFEVNNPAVPQDTSRGAVPAAFATANFEFKQRTQLLNKKIVEQEIDYEGLVDVAVNQFKLNAAEYRERIKKAIPNAFATQANKMPFVVTLSGESGCGKSHFATETAKIIASANENNICEFSTFQEKYPSPFICLHDALNKTTVGDKNIFKLENVSGKGIVFNTTNIVKKPVTYWQAMTSFMGIVMVFAALLDCVRRKIFPSFSLGVSQAIFPEVGFYRRLGFYGTYLIDREMVTIPEVGMFIESQPGFQWKYQNQVYSLEEMQALIIKKYDDYINGDAFDIVDSPPPNNYNVAIYFDNIDKALTYIQGFSLLQVKYGKQPVENGITVMDVSSLTGEAVNMNTILQFQPTASMYKTQTFRFLCYLRRQFPKLSIDIKIGNFRLSLSEGVIYGDMKPSKLEVTEIDATHYNLKEGALMATVTTEEILLYIDGASSLDTTSKVLVNAMIKAEKLPASVQQIIDDRLQESVNKVAITSWQAYCLKARSLLSSGVAMKVYLTAICALGAYGVLRFFSKGEQQEVTPQKGRARKIPLAGVSARYGNYYRSNGKVLYDGDAEFDKRAFYRAYKEHYENSEEAQDWDDVQNYNADKLLRQLAEEFEREDNKKKGFRAENNKAPKTNIRKKNHATVLVDADYYERLLKSFNKKELHHIVLPGHINVSGVEVYIRNRQTDAEFRFGRCTVVTCGLTTVVEIEGDATQFGFDTFPQMFADSSLQNNVDLFSVLTREFTTTKPAPVITQEQLETLEDEKYFVSPVTTTRTNGIRIFETNELYHATYHLVEEFPKDQKLTAFVGWKKENVSCYAVDCFKPQMVKYVPAAPTRMSRFKKLYQQQACIVNGQGATVMGLFISDTQVLTMKHVYAMGTNDSSVVVWQGEERKDYYLHDDFEIECSALYDIALLTFKRPVPSMKNMHKYLDSDFPSTRAVTLNILGNESQCDIMITAVIEKNVKTCKETNYQCGKLIKARIPHPEMCTISGDCGRPYVFYDPVKETFKILALHSGADQNHLYGSLIDKKLVLGFKNQAITSTVFRPVGTQKTRYTGVVEGENIEIVGVLNTPAVIPSEPYSQPSPLANYFGSLTPNIKGPAKNKVEELTSAEKELLGTDAFGNKDFFVNQIGYYNDVVRPFNAQHTKEFADGLAEELSVVFEGLEPMQILSDSEVLNGIRNKKDPLCGVANPMNWQGAIGVEFKNTFIGVNKKDHVVHSPDGSRTDMEFRQTPAALAVQQKYEQHVKGAWEGKAHFSLLQDNLKQENRIEEKRYKARVFTAFPMDLSMFERKILLRFLSSITKKHSCLPYKIGINTETEFNIEYIKARAFAKQTMSFGFDLSRCDKHMLEQYFRDALEAALVRMTVKQHISSAGCNCEHSLSEHLSALHVAVGHLFYNLVASQDVVYLKKRGNSSGSDATAPLNSIYLDFLVFQYYKFVMEQRGAFSTFKTYRADLMNMFYGDDGKVVVRDELQNYFGFLGFKNFLAPYGIGIDVPTKDGKDYWLQHYTLVPFISRSWFKLPTGHYTHQFKEDILSGLIYWTTDLDQTHLIQQVQLIGDICLTYGHERYEQFRLLLGKFLSEFPIAYDLLEFPSYQVAVQELANEIQGPPLFQREIKSNKVIYNNPTNDLF